jgi:membrane protease YdiL (CAAX protease family)
MVRRVKAPVREALAVWAAILLGLAAVELAGHAIPFVGGLTGALAVAAFLYLPMRFLEGSGQDARDAGWRFDRLPRDLLWSLGACAIVLPLFTAAFWIFPTWLEKLPSVARALLAPYASSGLHRLRLPLTLDFAGQVAGNAAVALAEEFFYRGYLTLRFEERMRPVPAALLAAALFALGHLLTPAPWRLAVFFPALLFAFLRRRTGTVIGAAICHFLCNVWLLILNLST